MDKILHNFDSWETICPLVFTGESSFQSSLGGAGFRPSTVGIATSASIFSTRKRVHPSCWTCSPNQAPPGHENLRRSTRGDVNYTGVNDGKSRWQNPASKVRPKWGNLCRLCLLAIPGFQPAIAEPHTRQLAGVSCMTKRSSMHLLCESSQGSLGERHPRCNSRQRDRGRIHMAAKRK